MKSAYKIAGKVSNRSRKDRAKLRVGDRLEVYYTDEPEPVDALVVGLSKCDGDTKVIILPADMLGKKNVSPIALNSDRWCVTTASYLSSRPSFQE